MGLATRRTQPCINIAVQVRVVGGKNWHISIKLRLSSALGVDEELYLTLSYSGLLGAANQRLVLQV